jgi:D-glycero-D-manno-heptose 1,7-bisphosphate phosphatase
MNRAVFLDRDGVINKVILRNGKPFSPRKIEDFELCDGIKEFLLVSKNEGFLNIAITNQPDIARKLVEWDTLNAMHKIIIENLDVNDIFVCPHDSSDNCLCRKPKAGMLFNAAEKWNIDLPSSFLIGDQWKDMEAGKNAGCITILLECIYNKEANSDFRVKNLQSAIEIITNKRRKTPKTHG